MSSIVNHWKLFGAFLIIGLFCSFGLRAALSGGDPTPPAEPRVAKRGQQNADERAPERPAELLIDLGNETCPVMGGAVDGKTYGEWNHIRVGYCCAGCDRKFLNDPEGLLDKAGIEWGEAAKAVQEYLAAKGEHKGHVLASIRKRWTVVQEPNGG